MMFASNQESNGNENNSENFKDNLNKVSMGGLALTLVGGASGESELLLGLC